MCKRYLLFPSGKVSKPFALWLFLFFPMSWHFIQIYWKLQSTVCVKQLAYGILELLVISVFPELRELVLDIHAKKWCVLNLYTKLRVLFLFKFSPFWGCKSAFPMMWNPRMPSFLMASPLVFSHFIGTDGIQFWDVGNTKEVCISFILTVQKLYILIMYRSQLCNLKLLLPISTPFQGFCIWFWIIASLKKQEL